MTSDNLYTKRTYSLGLAALVAGGMSLTAAHVTTAARPNAMTAAASYRASTLYPRNGAIAGGAMIAMPAPGATKVMLYVAYLAPMQVYHEQVQFGTCARPGRLAS